MSSNNNYYKVVTRIEEVFDNNPTVNTIIYARSENSDIFKNTVYPMVHINPDVTPWVNSASNVFSFEIGVLNQRIQDNRIEDTKIDGDTNVLDNHNTCYAIINDFLTIMGNDNGDGIYVDIVGDLQPIFFDNFNGLDGWSFNITLKIMNEIDVC